MFYFLKSHTHEFKYDVKIQQNYLGESVFALKSSISGDLYYNQMDISLAAPNRYLFALDSSSNAQYELDFGTTLTDLISSSYITRGRTPGTNKAFVLLNLSDVILLICEEFSESTSFVFISNHFFIIFRMDYSFLLQN